MTVDKAEKFRDEMQERYKECNGVAVEFDDVVRVSKDGQEFIVGRYAKKEHVDALESKPLGKISAYDRSVGGMFIVPFKKRGGRMLETDAGDLTDDSLTIHAEARTPYIHTSFSRDGKEIFPMGGMTDLNIHTGKALFKYGQKENDGDLSYRTYLQTRQNEDWVCFHRVEDGVKDVSSPKVWAEMIENGIRDDVRYTLEFLPEQLKRDTKKYADLTAMFERFAGEITPAEMIVSQEKGQGKKHKSGYSALKAFVKDKRKQLAAAVKKRKDKDAKDLAAQASKDFDR